MSNENTVEFKVLIAGIKQVSSRKTGEVFDAVTGVYLPEGQQLFCFLDKDSPIRKNKFVIDKAFTGVPRTGVFAIKISNKGVYLNLLDVKEK